MRLSNLAAGLNNALETSFNYSFNYDPGNYRADWFYEGGYHWSRHYYPRPGELKSDGEEFNCAVGLESQPEVLYSVRNIAGQKLASFSLPTATDLSYPDFVAALENGRTLVVEYKGEHISDTADTLEKRSVGEKYEDHSKRKALFLMAVSEDEQGRDPYAQIRAKIAGTL
jgi:type III restriction enzyme